ncbi:calcium-binding protein [Oleomonas cavernae]|uniref:Calcium-binding protein n=1 Tax=Oleomonas cavernae TaxID=2320859 RepID=A0A418WBH1_9PROT|nr:calcium-binding protein [Oleomonas cavernae]RJF87355.1 calcium-binding protein [Oleomonas cavernae]
MSVVAELSLPDGTVIAFNEHFFDDDPGSGWVDYFLYQIAEVIAGPPRPSVYIYDFEYLHAEPTQTDDDGFDYDYRKNIDVVNQDFAAFDNLTYLTTYEVETTTTYYYYDKDDVFYFSSRIELVYVGSGDPVTTVLDTSNITPAYLLDQPGDKVGALWVDAAGADDFTLAWATIGNDGRVTRRVETIDQAQVETSPTLQGFQIAGAALGADGTLAVALRIDGAIFLAGLSPRFDLVSPVEAVDGGSDGELISLLALPGGGFAIATVVHDGGGNGATVYLRAYDEHFDRFGAQLVVAIADWGGAFLTVLEGGDVQLSWSEGGSSHSQVFDLAGIVDVGGEAADTLIGTSWSDSLSGAGGNDEIIGNGGADTLYGNEGNDILVGGLGADLLDGGTGNDIARYDTKVTVNLSDSSKSTGAAAGDTYVSVEQIRGSAENDRLEGNGANNSFQGRAGDDVLSGGAGDDLLVGNAGADRLRGGAGADQFRFDRPSDGGDIIADFTVGSDIIAVRAGGFGISTIALVSAAVPAPAGSAPVFLFSTGDGILSFDSDGTGGGAAVVIAQLTGVHALSTSDLVLIA